MVLTRNLISPGTPKSNNDSFNSENGELEMLKQRSLVTMKAV